MQNGDVVIKESRGQVVIERRAAKQEGADFKYDREIFDPMHRNQYLTGIRLNSFRGCLML